MSTGVLLAVRWAANEPEDPKPLKWVVASFLPKLLHATSVTIGRKTRSRESFEQASDGHKRHEARHVKQQAGGSVVWWLVRYANPFSSKFRKAMEADAKAQEDASVRYPTFRWIANVQTRRWWWPF